jgi:uncharacterized membrane protein YeaQ/YmgE (transglycosylase-associated protein family)
MQFKPILMAAGAVVSLLAFEPTTILMKVAIGAAGAAVGAVLAEPLETEARKVQEQIQAVRTQMAQKPVEAEVVN